MLSEETKNFLEAVTNPFGCTYPARVPDRFASRTVSLTDYNYQVNYTANFDGGGTVNGLFLMIVPCYTSLLASYTIYSPTAIYQCIMCPTYNGILQPNTGSIGTLIGVNHEAIVGSATSYNVLNSLIESLRIFGAGMRVWPKLEYVTDSSSLYVTGYYAGLIKAIDVENKVAAGASIETIVRNSENLQVYANSQGASVRLNPFVLNNYLGMRTLLDSATGNTFDGSDMSLPFIYVTINQEINDGTPFPFYISVQWWIEGVLKQPTPIYSSASPVDLEFDRVSGIMCDTDAYPITAPGHSFKKFRAAVGAFNKAANTALQYSSLLAKGKYIDIARKGLNDYERSNKNRKKRRQRGIGETVDRSQLVAPHVRNTPATGNGRKKKGKGKAKRD